MSSTRIDDPVAALAAATEAPVPWHDYTWHTPEPAPEPEPPRLPFVVRYFHSLCLAGVFIAVGLQWPLGMFSAQAPLDPYVHFIFPMTSGSILVSYLFWDTDQPAPLPTMIMVGSIGVTAEVLWETAEFAGDNLWGLHWQLGNTDTMHDLITGVFGAAFGALTHAAIEDIR